MIILQTHSITCINKFAFVFASYQNDIRIKAFVKYRQHGERIDIINVSEAGELPKLPTVPTTV